MKNYIKLFEEFDPLSPDDERELRRMGFGQFSWTVHLAVDEYRAASFTPEEIKAEVIKGITEPGLNDAGDYQIDLDSIQMGNWDPADWNDFDPSEDGYPDGADLTLTLTLTSDTDDWNEVYDWVQNSLIRYSRCLDDIISIDLDETANENLTSDDERELRRMGFGATNINWDVELEIEFDAAHDTDSEYIKGVFMGWLPDINSISDEFKVQEDSVDIDEWTEEDYVIQDDEVPTEDDIDRMRKPKLLDLIDELDLEVDTDDATREKLGDLRDLIKMAIEDHGFGEMNYGLSNFIRFRLLTSTDNADEVSKWIEENIIDGRVLNDINSLERVD